MICHVIIKKRRSEHHPKMLTFHLVLIPRESEELRLWTCRQMELLLDSPIKTGHCTTEQIFSFYVYVATDPESMSTIVLRLLVAAFALQHHDLLSVNMDACANHLDDILVLLSLGAFAEGDFACKL